MHLQGRGDLARQIHRQVRAAILDGRLHPGDRLPPTRELARRLQVSRNTVSLAYEWLVAEGLLSGRKGAGSFVERVPVARAPRRAATPLAGLAPWQSLEPPAARERAPLYDFGVGAPDAALFPFDAWRRLLSRQLRASALTGAYGDPAGHPRARAAIARHVGVSRGVRADAAHVIVTNGAQGAFDLVARVALERGARVAVEEPGYTPARRLFESYGARVTPVPVDAAGLVVDALPADARLVYVTPSHQFPLGMPLAHARRVALLDWARRREVVIVEDDYDSEFRFGGRPLETLQALDRDGRVVYVGSFSKSLLPALRLGFIVAPASLRAALRAASYVATGHVQWPAQAALAKLIDGGLLARHLRRMRRVYAARHATVLRALESTFAGWLEPLPSVTGLHVAARLRAGGLAFEREIAERAHRDGVAFDRLSSYCAGDARQAGVVLGYGAIDEARLDEGLRRLRRCFVAARAARAARER